jgi:hypothetical protein
MTASHPVSKPVGSLSCLLVTPNSHTYQHFSPQCAQELLSIYRTMFPHKDVSDEAYPHVVRKLDERVAQDQALAALLSDGVGPLKWSTLSEGAKTEALRRRETTPFFKTLRAEFIIWFYSNPRVWSRFGYEGPSNDKGGYLHRGFNDIDWIDQAEN